jgi:hypothetical protein
MADADGGGARQVTHDGVDAENATATPDGKWLVYNSGDPNNNGLWKIHPDGTGATRLLAGTFLWPEISPDGRYVSYGRKSAADLIEVQVVRIDDGAVDPLVIGLRSSEALGGRTRWFPDGRLAFNGKNEGRAGIFSQEFRPGVDTSSTQRVLVPFEEGSFGESFGISPDGSRLTLAKLTRTYGLMGSENVPGIEPPPRGR